MIWGSCAVGEEATRTFVSFESNNECVAGNSFDGRAQVAVFEVLNGWHKHITGPYNEG